MNDDDSFYVSVEDLIKEREEDGNLALHEAGNHAPQGNQAPELYTGMM